MKEEYEVLRRQLKIDRDRLDEELIRQPSYYAHVSTEETYAISERDAAKDDLKRAFSVLQLSHREVREEQKLKCTDSILLGCVEDDLLYQEAQRTYREAAQRASLWTALREAVQQRSYILKDLCGLWLGSYFSSSSVSGVADTDGSNLEHDRVRRKVAEARRTGNTRKAPPE